MKPRGFSLVELLIVVALIGIVAAIAVPALMLSRISANEAATIVDVREVMAAQAAYAIVNQRYYDSNLSCLNGPAGCIPNYPPEGATFLDSSLGALLPGSGYARSFHAGPAGAFPTASASPTSTTAFVYLATPLTVGVTGVRGFAGDASGRLCWTPDGSVVPESSPGQLDPTCPILD
jgi:type IV pilus assembly protein PilA